MQLLLQFPPPLCSLQDPRGVKEATASPFLLLSSSVLLPSSETYTEPSVLQLKESVLNKESIRDWAKEKSVDSFV